MICDECETVAHCLKNGCVPKTNKKDEALKLALEALKWIKTGMGCNDIDATITAIKEALAAPVQEPVAWVERWYGSGPDRGWWVREAGLTHGNAIAYIGEGDFAERLASLIVEKHNTSIHTTPPAAQRQWAGLTASEVDRCWNMTPMDTRNSRHMFAYSIEAKLKEKNT